MAVISLVQMATPSHRHSQSRVCRTLRGFHSGAGQFHFAGDLSTAGCGCEDRIFQNSGAVGGLEADAEIIGRKGGLQKFRVDGCTIT